MKKGQGAPVESRPWFKVWPDHLPRSLNYPDVPASWLLEQGAGRYADRTAVIFVNHEDLTEISCLTYGDLWSKANGLAAGLRELGIQKGDMVGVLLPNCPSIIISYYGIWLAGASISPCNAMAKEKEIAYQLRDSGARLLIASDALCGLASSITEQIGIPLVPAPAGDKVKKEDIPCARTFEEMTESGKERPTDFTINPSEDMAVLLYTGGTTGDPKGAILTHRNIVANTLQFAHWYDFLPGGETCVCTIPMSHSGGMSGVMNVPLYSGATMIIMKRFSAENVARAVEKYGATRFFGVPTMYVALLNNESARKCDMTSLKACRTNAAPLPVAVKQSFDQLIGKEVLVEGYGLTETSPLTHANPIQRPKEGSIGIPLPDTDCKIIDLQTGEDLPVGCEGELVIRGPQLMKGYWNKPEATAKAMAGGWFHTGDVAKMDEDGYFFIVDRLKDMINTGGYKVWPREVEEVIYRYPKVRLVMVIGVEDGFYGEVVKAFIVPKEDSGEITSDEIIAHCKKTMATYKVPRLIEICESLPISPQGKVMRRLMRDKEKEKKERKENSCDVCSREEKC